MSRGNNQGNQQPHTGSGLNLAPEAPKIQIGMWGGPLTGKSTYLAALRLSALFQPAEGHWMVTPDPTAGSVEDTRLQDDMEGLLAQRFPATGTTSTTDYSLIVSGNMTRSVIANFESRLGSQSVLQTLLDRFNNQNADRLVEFKLKVWDYPGSSFVEVISKDTDQGIRLREYLANCTGLIYLYDPTVPHNFRHLNTGIEALWGHLYKQHRLINGVLPHYVAVCVSKFEDPRVFEPVCDAGLVNTLLPNGMPYVADPKAAFEFLTQQDLLSRHTIARRFLSSRTGYFMTSSIGFFRQPNGEVTRDDYCNYWTPASGELIIRGRAEPINVLEPLLWIYYRAIQDGLVVAASQGGKGGQQNQQQSSKPTRAAWR